MPLCLIEIFVFSYWVHSKFLTTACHPPQHLVPSMFHNTLVASSWRVGYLVVPFPPCGLPHFGCLLTWTLVLASCLFFSPFLGCFLFIKFGKVSSVGFNFFCKYLVNVTSSWFIHKPLFLDVVDPLTIVFVDCNCSQHKIDFNRIIMTFVV